MGPKTHHKLDSDSFKRLAKRVHDFSETRKQRIADPDYATQIPTELGLQLTYACNLRCKMCYQWNEDGYFHSFGQQHQKLEIDAELFNKILHETFAAKSSLYLWGGEPLFHSDFSAIAASLEADPRYTTMCTNGLLIEQHMESILKISSNLAVLCSVDGLDDANDDLRGKRTFERLMKQLKLLIDEQRKGNFKGTISINAVLNDRLAPDIELFMEFFEDLGVDSVYFNYPWYISEERAAEMDKFYAEKLSWLNNVTDGVKPSWHSYTYKLSPASADIIASQIDKLNTRTWNTRIRFQQHMEGDQIAEFITDKFTPNRSCFSYSSRLEILADGRAGTCSKFFPELSVGNLREEGLIDLWKSEKLSKLRNILSQQLMPACAKCYLLYRNGWG